MLHLEYFMEMENVKINAMRKILGKLLIRGISVIRG